eukprot:550713_1
MGAKFGKTSTNNLNLLTPLHLEKLITCVLREHDDILLVIKHIIIDYCMDMTQSKYYQILMRDKSHIELGTKGTEELESFKSLSTDSIYTIHLNQCPKCYKKKKDILMFHCSFTTNFYAQYYYMTVNFYQNRQNEYFENNVMEYQCKNCLHYIAFNMRNRIVRSDRSMCANGYYKTWSKHYLSVFGDRHKTKKHRTESRECPECHETMIKLGRTEEKNKRIGDYLSFDRYNVERDLCVQCDLVSTFIVEWTMLD